MTIYSYAYRSSPTAIAGRDFDSDLESILAVARASNAHYGLTGALLASERAFVQILEGNQSAITALMANIRNDSRNVKVETLLTEFRSDRRFGNWVMARVECDDVANDIGLDELSFAGSNRVRPLIERMAELAAA